MWSNSGSSFKSRIEFNGKFNEAKENYSSYDKELYDVLQALNKWIHYLMPREFVLYSNNHAL